MGDVRGALGGSGLWDHLPFGPSRGSVPRPSTCIPPSNVLSTNPPYQRKEAGGKAAGTLLPHSLPALQFSGWDTTIPAQCTCIWLEKLALGA